MTVDLVREAVVEGLVPTLLALGAVAGWLAASVVPVGDARRAAYAGWCAGVLAAVGYAILATSGAIVLRVPPAVGIIGLGTGLIRPVLYLLLRQSRAIGLLCLLQTFGSLAGLVTFFFVPGLHGATAWFSLCDAFGACLIFLVPRRAVDRMNEIAGRLAPGGPGGRG